jgi:hypothetical protein
MEGAAVKRYYKATIAFAVEGPDDYTIEQLGEHLAELVCLDLDFEEVGNMPDSKANVAAAVIDWSSLELDKSRR